MGGKVRGQLRVFAPPRSRSSRPTRKNVFQFAPLSPPLTQNAHTNKPQNHLAASLARADPAFISGGDSSFVPGVSAVQMGGDLYQPVTLTLDAGASAASAGAARAAASTRGSRAARAGGRKMLDDAAQQATTEQPPQQTNAGTITIDGEEYHKVSGR